MAQVLIVDDNPDCVELLREMLCGEHDVIGTTDATEALKLIQATAPDVLITDIRMPDHSGFTLIRMARMIRPELAVVIISAFYDHGDPECRTIVRWFTPAAVSKPFTIAAVTAALDAALSARTIPPHPAEDGSAIN